MEQHELREGLTMTLTRRQQIEALEKDWATNPRWKNVKRTYTAEEVVELRGSMVPANTIAQRGADKLWSLVNGESKKGYVNCLGALTGGQAVQQAKAGIEAIYLSGWQVAADNNTASTMYPDQSLYPVDSVPSVVKRINNSFRRADQIQWAGGKSPEDEGGIDYFLPIVADAEAGFGGVLNAYELMKSMIDAGAAGVHFEDQLASVKKCGHMGGKVLVPTQEAVQKLVAARLAADVAGTTTLVIARTDANAADLLTSDCDPYDKDFIQGERTAEGFYRVRAGIDQAIARGLAYAPYADLIWCETATPCLEEARKFAEAIHAEYPDQLLLITVRHHLTGRKTWMQRPSLSSSKSLLTWATSTSSLHSRAFITCGLTCLSWHMLTHKVKACATTLRKYNVQSLKQQRRDIPSWHTNKRWAQATSTA